MSFLVAMGQMLVEGGEVERNLERAAAMVRDAAAQGARLVVLPECLDIGWIHPRARELAQPIPGRHSGALAAAARTAGIHVAAGLTERAGDRVYNAAVLLAPSGEILLHHRKINELAIAHDLYATGDRLAVAETELGTVGIAICADNFSNSLALAHSLARMGCRLLLSPSAWAVDATHDNQREPYGGLWLDAYCELARLYDLTVIGVSNVGWLNGGPWHGRQCIGCSLAVGPGGEVMARGPYGPDAQAVILVAVQPVPLAARGVEIADLLARKGYRGP